MSRCSPARSAARLGVGGSVQARSSSRALALIGVLVVGGWAFGVEPSPDLLAVASGTAFTAVVLGQPRQRLRLPERNPMGRSVVLAHQPLLLWAGASEKVILAVFLFVPQLVDLLGG